MGRRCCGWWKGWRRKGEESGLTIFARMFLCTSRQIVKGSRPGQPAALSAVVKRYALQLQLRTQRCNDAAGRRWAQMKQVALPVDISED